MASVVKEFEHLKIRLEELKTATNNFGSKVIGTGGFGNVYGGEVVLHSKGRSMVAIKRLSREFGQGDPEFWKEIMMLTRYTHKNLVSLLGYCDEDGEKILVYEYASNGSLDRHLSSTFLTWTRRLKICLDVARGLTYLHDHKGTQQRVLHRDIKSSNILLDESWNAMLSDMGLSKIGPANQRHTVLYTNVVGTPGYCDPQYMNDYTLTKESDIYSFGVVLFEVMCGRLCFERTNSELKFLVPMWKQSYMNKKLDHIICRDLMPTIAPTSLKTFSDIAFECLHYSREQRPAASLLVKKLEIALKCQESHVMKLTNDMGTSRKMLWPFFSLGRKHSKEPPKPPYTSSTKGERNNLVVFEDGINTFDLEDLLETTAELLGEGTVGISYKTVLEEKKMALVVKRLKDDVVVTKNEFETIMSVFGKMKSKHLVPLRAYYYSENEKWLVYEYMPASSLSAHLHGSIVAGRTQLDWDHRIRIVLTIIKGLAYLHANQNVHGNIKSSNILILEETNTETFMTDYGLNTLFGSLKNHHVTGYMAPEVLNTKKATFESDVYSFGVLLLELLTGRNPNQASLDNEGVHSSNWIDSIVCEEPKAEIFDLELRRGDHNFEEMVQLLRIAKDCVSIVPDQRPCMYDVLSMTENMWLRLSIDDYSDILRVDLTVNPFDVT